MADFTKGKFLIERGPVRDRKEGTFLVHYRVFYADDTAKEVALFKGTYIYNGDQTKLRNRVNALLNRLDNTALDSAKDEIDAVLGSL